MALNAVRQNANWSRLGVAPSCTLRVAFTGEVSYHRNEGFPRMTLFKTVNVVSSYRIINDVE
jgi:hypothetical protein